MPDRLEAILRQYKDYIMPTWKTGLSPKERSIFLVYDKEDDRRMAALIPEFRLVTEQLSHGWIEFDCSKLYSTWISGHDYRESYFEEPELLKETLDSEFRNWIITRFHEKTAGVGENDVVALTGVGALYGFIRLSTIVEATAPLVKGRYLVFFPGEYEQNTYRFLDARDGWNYLAVALTGQGVGL